MKCNRLEQFGVENNDETMLIVNAQNRNRSKRASGFSCRERDEFNRLVLDLFFSFPLTEKVHTTT